MLDLLSIFGKGGIVLWCWQSGSELLSPSVNALVRNVFLAERGKAAATFQHNGLTLKYKLDNEFQLVFVVAYSAAVHLAYTDKLLEDLELLFRDRFRGTLADPRTFLPLVGSDHFAPFDKDFHRLWKKAEDASKAAPKKQMKSYDQSEKAQKSVASMVTKKADIGKEDEGKGKKKKKPKAAAKAQPEPEPEEEEEEAEEEEDLPPTNGTSENGGDPGQPTEEELMEMRRQEFKANFGKKAGPGAMRKGPKAKEVKTSPAPPGKKGKQGTKWGEALSKDEIQSLDYTSKSGKGGGEDKASYDFGLVGSMKGHVRDLDEGERPEEESEEEDEGPQPKAKTAPGFFSAFSSLVGGNKKLSAQDLAPALDKMKDNLIAKNVAAEIAEKFCESVGTSLEGKVISSWKGVKAVVNETVRDSLLTILQPRRRLDILRDIAEAKAAGRPFTIAFCGVNGVGKSTNLAKITFWLIENGLRVMIAAGDTFRAGAVEQLRTHTKHLNALHPGSVSLYDQGYGKDAAAVAKHAIAQAAKEAIDVVLVDTAGRMQDNEPLMRALAKLIRENAPDLVLFVGEALVGNEAVDQLVKFNQALADHSDSQDPRLIDGILLTKFDTIDDKVGAAISMTYITQQPIVFVGTGQTYKDLKNLNANAVVNALLK